MANNKNYYQRQRRGGKGKKIIAGVVAFVLTGAVVAGVVGYGSNWYRDMSFSRWFGSNEEQTEPETEEVGGGALITDTNESGGISLMSSLIDPADYEAAGIAEDAVTAYTITAIAEPADSVQLFYWEYTWDSDSIWAYNHSLNNYCTINTGGTLITPSQTLTVSLLKPFGAPIKITAHHALNYDDITGSCQLDYLRPITSYVNNTSTSEPINGIAGKNLSFNYTFTFGLGTIIGDISLFESSEFFLSSQVSMGNQQNTLNPYMKAFGDITKGTRISKLLLNDDESIAFNQSAATINGETATVKITINNVNVCLSKLLTFSEYTNGDGEKITPTYDDFVGSDLLKWALSYTTNRNYASYAFTTIFEYSCNDTSVAKVNPGSFAFKQSISEFPLPSDPTGMSLDESNLVFGI